MRGSASRARAKATSWRWPAESWTPRSPTSVSIPSGSAATNSVAPTVATAASISSRLASGPAEGDVFADAAGEEEALLGDDPELAPQRPLLDAAQVVAVDQDPALLRVVEAGDELGEGRLAGAGGADQGQRLARRHVEVDVAQRPGVLRAARRLRS